MNVPLQLTMAITPTHRNQYLFSDHYLDNLLRQDPRWEGALAEAGAFLGWLQGLYTRERGQLTKYNEDQLEEHWFKPILRQLGHVFEGQAGVPGLDVGVKRPDYVFFPDEETRQAAAGAQNTQEYAAEALAVGEVKRWEAPLSRKQEGGGASFEAQNPSWQVDYYVRITGVKWGLLSNGRRWRLVHRDTSERLSIYYEVDLVDLLSRGEAGAMRYFLLFFRQGAFRPDGQGRVFLEDALAASQAYAVALEEDVEGNVYQALERLMQGFLDLPANGLGRGDLRETYENSLYLLYRLLFILYGESRGLLPLHLTSYRDSYSLERLKREIAELKAVPAPMTTIYWGRLKQLFQIINGDNVELNRHLGVPRYNGRLFDPTQHPFLERCAVGDRALVEAIDLLSRRTTDGKREFVDYRTLGVRHLGSIYEGLLEYQPRYASEPMAAVRGGKGERWVRAAEVPEGARVVVRRGAGQVYLETDRGERKATGSYYTPQYIVEYIVEQTVGPLVEEAVARVKARSKRAKGKAARAAAGQSLVEEILRLKILDPAMGSGHFLVEATEYLARALAIDPYVETGAAAEEDLTHWKRRVVERCIYGVDTNPLAVELAKLSLWLATVAEDKPLSFLDHHLQCGDSLIGARVADVGAVPPVVLSKKVLREREAQYAAGVRQANLFEIRLVEKLPVVMGRILEITEVESDSYETVQAKEAADQAVRELKAPFQAVANLWVSAYFGNELTQGEYDEALGLVGRREELLALPAVERAQEVARERRFFHWELAFPEVFYDRNGQPLREAAGFDAVVGNPPYFLLQGTDLQGPLSNIYPEVFSGSNDVSHFFLVRGVQLLRSGRRLSFIVTRYWIEAYLSSALRNFLTTSVRPTRIIDFGNLQVWPEVNVLTVVCIFKKSPTVEATEVYVADERCFSTAVEFFGKGIMNASHGPLVVNAKTFGSEPWRLRAIEGAPIWGNVRSQAVTLGQISQNTQGIKTGNNSVFTVTLEVARKHDLEGKALIPVTQAQNLQRYSIQADEFVIYVDGSFDIDETPAIKSYLSRFRAQLSKRAECNRGLYPWWRLQRPRDRKLVLHGPRILVPLYATENRFFFSKDPVVGMTDVYIVVVTDKHYEGAFLSGVLNSRLLNSYHSTFCKVKRAGYLEYSGNAISELPIRRIEFATPAEERGRLVERAKVNAEESVEALVVSGIIGSDSPLDRAVLLQAASSILEFVGERMAAQPEQSDVVHDLLAHLAEQMIAMNKEKQAVVEAFWLDLEGVVEGAAFETLRNQGKQECTLWQRAVACRPFVRVDSHSTRRLDESLGWSEEAFKAFVKILVGKLQWLSDVVDVYRVHSLGYRELVARIEATDWLIDQIVYKLYGLTEEEVAVVEGGSYQRQRRGGKRG